MRICIEGNIGCGKSSVLSALATDHSLHVFPEPLEKWGELLDLFYQNKEQWSLAFSLKVLLESRESNQLNQKGTVCIVERSPVSGKNVFAKILKDDGFLSPLEYETLAEYYDVMGWTPDAIIFVDTPAAICLQRIKQRARECEKDIDLVYLKRLEFAYESMLKTQVEGLRVIRIDGTQQPKHLALSCQRAINTLMNN
jgi:deoxyadenosine/deoxycytidine kinase